MRYHITVDGITPVNQPISDAKEGCTLIMHYRPEPWPYGEGNWLKLGSHHTVTPSGKHVRCLGRIRVWFVDIGGDEDIAALEKIYGAIQVGLCPHDKVTHNLEFLEIDLEELDKPTADEIAENWKRGLK